MKQTTAASIAFDPKATAAPWSNHGHGAGGTLPEFHAEPTLLEVFFDLFFAAKYNVFSDDQEVTSHSRLNAYFGYFFLLWVTWLLVTLFDVRYVTDSIFARLTRAVQLGVLVGFTIVAPKFNPADQHTDTMRAMCTSFLACIGVSSVDHSQLLSNLFTVLSFTSTHLIKRLTLLTVIIIGDGIIQVAREVVIIVKNPDSWDRVTIGLVTSAIATIYFIFLVYFDWLRSSFYLPALRQQLWMMMHLSFHLSLILFTQGFTQFLIWSKIVDVINTVSVGMSRGNVEWLYTTTSEQVQERMNVSAQLFFREFPPRILSTWLTVDALANITQIPDAFWPDLANYYKTDDVRVLENTDFEATEIFSNILRATMSSMANALFATFGMDFESEVTNRNPRVDEEIRGGGFQGEVQDTTWDRYKLVFAYTYVAAGSTLLFIIVLAVIARTTRFKAWPVIRLTIIFLLALGTSLTAMLFFNPTEAFDFLLTLWVLPTITFVWAVVLVITHINGENVGRHMGCFNRNKPPASSPPSPSSLSSPTGSWSSRELSDKD